MEGEKISSSQFFILIVFFELGTAIVLPIGFASQKDVWLSILIASIGGCFLFMINEYLSRQYPQLPLSGYAQIILGKHIGRLLSFLYILFFIYIASRDLREAGELMTTSAYSETPLIVIELLLILVITYGLYKGIEVLARTAELSILIYIVITLVGNSAIIFGGYIKIENLFPILEKGWTPVMKTAYPNIVMFPFGEMICFTTILPNLKNREFGKMIGLSALILVTIIIGYVHALSISVLSEPFYSRSLFPLLDVMRRVQIGEFLERLDILPMLTLVICDFYKISIYCFAAVTVASDIFKFQNKHKMIIPVVALTLYTSLVEASNISEHFKEGELDLKFILPIFCFIFPVLLLLVHLIRKKGNGLTF